MLILGSIIACEAMYDGRDGCLFGGGLKYCTQLPPLMYLLGLAYIRVSSEGTLILS